jgi:hypothetical protein
MYDLEFAIDGLYAAGWWPADNEDCLQADDARWYPSTHQVHEAFAQSGIDISITMPSCGHPVTVRWSSSGCGHCTVTAQTRCEAMLLAFTQLYTSTRISIPG